ncbi:hypothetical protein GBAR_LOCUS750 [Geodia barretti]|uniref:Uncharacterized protein n=1 Tax=Geodia barretti TaxID=519541 RepID=A0AA35QTS3_GEOBA|nr:hypothetical protein GBAR_LOCUS750 [Geodia barretti]
MPRVCAVALLMCYLCSYVMCWRRSIVSVRGRNMTINWIPSTGTVSINRLCRVTLLKV